MKTKSQPKNKSKFHSKRTGLSIPQIKLGRYFYHFDDFLDRIITMKEHGDLIISGVRIC